MEATKPVQQAFGSPGGKSYLAPRIAAMMPPHKTYVEPFAGGAAVFFRKEPSQKEVLSDKDAEIAFAFKFLRDMTPEQWQRLQKKDWVKRASTFARLKASKPKDDVERFYRFYYLKKASFARGGKQFSHYDAGGKVGIDRLERVQERLRKSKTKVYNTDAKSLIDKYDSKDTFFYLDPPYPDRAFIGQTFKNWTEDDLKALLEKLKGIKGKCALSLGTEHTRFMPKGWHVSRVKVWRRIPAGDGEFNQTSQYEIIATNYDPGQKMAGTMPKATLPQPVRSKAALAQRRAIMPEGAYTDQKGNRLARRYHRGWKKAPRIIAR